MATTIVLVRHGETDWNRENRFQGHADPPLNATGRAQALELSEELDHERFGAVYSSPLRRAYETATILAGPLALDPIQDGSLMEVDLGSWSGLTREQAPRRSSQRAMRGGSTTAMAGTTERATTSSALASSPGC